VFEVYSFNFRRKQEDLWRRSASGGGDRGFPRPIIQQILSSSPRLLVLGLIIVCHLSPPRRIYYFATAGRSHPETVPGRSPGAVDRFDILRLSPLVSNNAADISLRQICLRHLLRGRLSSLIVASTNFLSWTWTTAPTEFPIWS
jgi:hypothetical protein